MSRDEYDEALKQYNESLRRILDSGRKPGSWGVCSRCPNWAYRVRPVVLCELCALHDAYLEATKED